MLCKVGEILQGAALRERREEVGLDIDLTSSLSVYISQSSGKFAYISISWLTQKAQKRPLR